MAYSYAAKNGRKYPYYVCRSAQRHGWGTCPSKSLPSQAIEESVLQRIRRAQDGLADATAWEQMDRGRQIEAIQSMVERIGYNGATHQILIRFRSPETAVATEPKVPA